MISFLSSVFGKRYLTRLRRERLWGDLRFNQGFDEGWKLGFERGETKGAYDSLVITLQNLFDEAPSKIEPVLKEKDLSELRRLLGLAFKCASYEEFVNLAIIEKTPKHKLAPSR